MVFRTREAEVVVGGAVWQATTSGRRKSPIELLETPHRRATARAPMYGTFDILVSSYRTASNKNHVVDR